MKPILIAGPTASGKSGLALAVARAFDGVIVNADASQVYQDLQIITARPSHDEMGQVPHKLYGHVSGGTAYSTGAWLEDITQVLKDLEAAQKRAIIVGGTGLYFQALLNGLSNVPKIDEEIRAFWRQEADRLGAQELHKVLQLKDPIMAKRLNPADTQRVVRALEVIEGTGRSLDLWQQETGPALLDLSQTVPFVLQFEREVLYQRIDERFEQMVHQGGLEEVKVLLGHGFDEGLPIMRALGVPELSNYLKGDISLDEAIKRAAQQTRRYAKRQLTWLRRNMLSWNNVNAQQMATESHNIFSKIYNCG